ncbi:MAG: type II toxin-antitoxin system HipA family toxin [Candidatus Obscuribacterales bacterium]|nr:type II toxin-antitoxin system HipA family toxin [Candidatus Obscuribacterales bacterium]
MKKLNVIYLGWGERFQLGVLADDGKSLLFEYTAEAIKRGLELSPYKLPLSANTYGDFPEHQLRLPGLVSDALPDGWGMLLMDRLFRKEGRNPANISPLDRLAFIGDRAMGALGFEPSETETLTKKDVQLLDLAEDVRHVLEGESELLLRQLAMMGGSPHGARPKVLVNFDRENNRMSNSASGAGIPVMVKFPARYEHKEVCAMEAMYSRIADTCGIRIPVTEYFDLNKELSAFGIERFDRLNGMRIPMHTAAGAAHVNFRIPQLDYVSLLRLTQLMTHDTREVLEAFERCVFNVVFNNRDDHSKNFSFLMDKDGRWRVSPVYDLTFSEGPRGEHQMDICGESRNPSRRHLLELASKTGVTKEAATEVIERITTVADGFTDFVENLPIRTQTMKKISAMVEANRERLI